MEKNAVASTAARKITSGNNIKDNSRRKVVLSVNELTENDILMGRGKGKDNFPGNRVFRKVVDSLKDEYLNAFRREKVLVARKVMQQIQQLRPPGRFFEPVNKTTSNSNDDDTINKSGNIDTFKNAKSGGKEGDGTVRFFMEVNDEKKIFEKVFHALRAKERKRQRNEKQGDKVEKDETNKNYVQVVADDCDTVDTNILGATMVNPVFNWHGNSTNNDNKSNDSQCIINDQTHSRDSKPPSLSWSSSSTPTTMPARTPTTRTRTTTTTTTTYETTGFDNTNCCDTNAVDNVIGHFTGAAFQGSQVTTVAATSSEYVSSLYSENVFNYYGCHHTNQQEEDQQHYHQDPSLDEFDQILHSYYEGENYKSSIQFNPRAKKEQEEDTGTSSCNATQTRIVRIPSPVPLALPPTSPLTMSVSQAYYEYYANAESSRIRRNDNDSNNSIALYNYNTNASNKNVLMITKKTDGYHFGCCKDDAHSNDNIATNEIYSIVVNDTIRNKY